MQTRFGFTSLYQCYNLCWQFKLNRPVLKKWLKCSLLRESVTVWPSSVGRRMWRSRMPRKWRGNIINLHSHNIPELMHSCLRVGSHELNPTLLRIRVLRDVALCPWVHSETLHFFGEWAAIHRTTLHLIVEVVAQHTVLSAAPRLLIRYGDSYFIHAESTFFICNLIHSPGPLYFFSVHANKTSSYRRRYTSSVIAINLEVKNNCLWIADLCNRTDPLPS